MRRNLEVSIGLWLLTLMTAFLILFPITWIISSSFTSEKYLYTSPVRYLPVDATLDNYKSLFHVLDIANMAKNTIKIVIITIIGTIIVSFISGYGFSRLEFKGKSIIYTLLIFSAMLPMIITLIPLARMMKALNLTDTIWGLSILYISSFIPFTTMIFTNSIHDVPIEMDEAAEIDGAGIWRKIFGITMPLLKPVVATIAIIIFIWTLNEFMIPLVFSSQNAVPFSVGISMVPRVQQLAIPWEKISAMGTLIIAPIILFVTIFQRQIMEGLMAGGVKQ